MSDRQSIAYAVGRSPLGATTCLLSAACTSGPRAVGRLNGPRFRLATRLSAQKALGAVKHSILVACWHMLSTGELYIDLGGDYFRKRDPERIAKRLIAQLESLGHKVVLEKLPQAA